MTDCFDSDTYFVGIDFDTTVSDPTLTATIVDLGGEAKATWTIAASELTY